MEKVHALLRVLLWSFAFVGVVLFSLKINQVDLWWQLPEGLHLWRTFTLPVQPVSAYGLPAAPYVDEYAGYEMALALVYKIGGFGALWLVFAWIFLGIIFLPFASGRKKFSSFDLPSTLALLLAGTLLWQRMEERPSMVGTLLLVILIAILRRASLERMSWRLPICSGLIFAAWTNTHSSFVLGLFTLFLWIACEIALPSAAGTRGPRLRHGLVLAASAIFACLLSPLGLKRLLFPFWQYSDPGSTALSMEMWPTRFLAPPLQIMVAAAALLLLWALLAARGRPLWLTLFSIVAVYLAATHFRFAELLVVALLFSFSFRDERRGARTREPLPFLRAWRWIETPLVAICCAVLLLFESLGACSLWNEMVSQPRFATNTTYFAPEIVDRPDGGPSEPVLCSHGEGAYLSFDPRQRYRPLLDSGLAHFSDNAKRYFFFLLHEPAALDYALDHLQVKTVILDRGQTDRWALLLQRKAGWNLARCTPAGQLWKKGAPSQAKMAPALRLQVEKSRDGLERDGKIFDAFCYDTLLGQPAESLRLIANNSSEGWTPADCNFLLDWINAQPREVAANFLTRESGRLSPAMRAMLEERVEPGHAETSSGASALEKLLRARAALFRGDQAEARKILDTLPAHPPASVLYYTLLEQADPAALDAYGRWEAWDDKARDFFVKATGQLNAHLAQLALEEPSRPKSGSGQ